MIIKARFRVKEGHLELRNVFSGLPQREALYYVSRSIQKQILSIEDLQSYVVLNSKESVIDFVRLRTSPLTYQVLAALTKSKLMSEIIYAGSFNSLMTFGNEKLVTEIKEYSDGYLGVTSKKILNKIGFFNPKIKIVDNSFIIKRFVIMELDIYKLKSIIISEKINYNGDYKYKIEKEIKYNYQGWRFPYN